MYTIFDWCIENFRNQRINLEMGLEKIIDNFNKDAKKGDFHNLFDEEIPHRTS